jgi:uncharacterized protein YoxC
MIKATRFGFICMLALTLGFAVACNMYETDKANKLVDAANTSIKDANDKMDKGTTTLQQVETAVPQIEDQEGLDKARAMAKDSIASLEKARDGYTDAGSKFADASKLKLQDKFKEYLDLKGQEMKKRGEMVAALLGEPQALLSSDNREAYEKTAADVTAKVQSIKKDVDALEAKANKIYEDNKAIFKQS